ncbi:hypothetical protein ARMGADRAFT_1164025 [Armillaria gallica]|uniref:F-box domain-containing protein n=1 Tax=Armillaria gallica TaxID=47427 RepID=A0A2H3DX88_ARMGA|nr:hypothetical protein ARMGADRAFT_1164025 [Armillaria gallica]
MLDPCPQLPPELVHAIISELWYSEHSSEDRVIFMKTCPLINSLWKDVFAHVTSRDIFVPTGRYLLYLSSIIRNNNSLIYHTHLPHSTRTITCHVDLVEANKDATQEPYTTLSQMPNYIGFRKCFPNIKKIFLEVRYRVRGRWFLLILSQHQIIRTQISIALDQATTQLSILPVDWEIAAYNPAPDYIYGQHADPNWTIFLEDVIHCMAPGPLFECFGPISFKDMISRSTYINCVRRFSGHGILTETKGDVQGTNRHFGRAARRPFSLWTFLAEAYEDITWIDDTVPEHTYWHAITLP